MKISFVGQQERPLDVIVVPVFDGKKIAAQTPDPWMAGFINKALENETSFKGKRGQTMVLHGYPSDEKIVLLGLGKKNGLDRKSAGLLAPPLYKAIQDSGKTTVGIACKELDLKKIGEADFAGILTDALLQKSYVFDKYKTKKPDAKPLAELDVITTEPSLAVAVFSPLEKVTLSSFWARDLANEPANVLNPETYVDRLKRELRPLGITVRALDADKMKSLGMGAALAVGQGSKTPPQMVVLEYDGSNGAQKSPIALVGKGITFDSGGLSLKPGAGMANMVMDMSGSAAVAGAMRALALRKASVNAVAILALAENMPDAQSCRPGDIVTSMSGQTIRIDNTDAEGRLVLCDAMTYIQRTYSPHTMVELSTLTGACAAALGKKYAGVFANDDALWRKLEDAGKVSGDLTWRMPLHDDFTDAMKDHHADLVNSISQQGIPGASAAAGFLHMFVEKDKNGKDKCKWAHVDIAGPAIFTGSGGASGYGVRLLDRLIHAHYEQSGPAWGHEGPCIHPKAPGLG